jgi:hypothetical protein
MDTWTLLLKYIEKIHVRLKGDKNIGHFINFVLLTPPFVAQ